MKEERRNSKIICDAYVLAKEIALSAAKTDSRHFDPVWLYERVVALPEPPDEKERRAAARAFIKAGHAALTHARPDLAGEIFEKAFFLVSESKSGMLRSKALAGIKLSWQQMGKPKVAEAFITKTLAKLAAEKGDRARLKQERQLEDAMEKAKKVRLPKRIRTPTGDFVRGKPKRRAHTSTALKKQS